MNDRKCFLVGISGASSSGKTTLARALRDIWPNVSILHEDDFYWPDSQIPEAARGLQDWDCLEALDLNKLENALKYIKANGTLPPDHHSKEDQNSVGESDLSNYIPWKRGEIAESDAASVNEKVPVVLVDGFLLYSQKMEHIHHLFDLKLFLRTRRELCKLRRERRTGYVTLDGFWEDPPGYVDNVVWPNYVLEHRYLFQNADVEGDYDLERCKEVKIHPLPRVYMGELHQIVDWGCHLLSRRLVGDDLPFHKSN